MHYLFDGPEDAAATFAFAHGAGGAMDTPWMTRVARALAANGIRVVRFEFPYMASRRHGKKSSAPDRQPILLDTWRNVITDLGDDIAIGGKSLGGRMASMVADEMRVRALVCFGYPFHPPGRPERLRTEHLEALRTRALILQGERDPFGTPEDVAGYKLSPSIRVEWLPDGDHSLKPRATSGNTESRNLQKAIDLASRFILQ
ncbi:MAG TPA: alpha/beta family hydrolase [Thermoanaerobaculia bacterium]|nr:alpha/beta family hydrolase [Thermoanaerobaculia bacterium]